MNEFLSFDLLQIGLNPKMMFNLFLFLQHIQTINFDVDTVWGTYNKFTSTDSHAACYRNRYEQTCVTPILVAIKYQNLKKSTRSRILDFELLCLVVFCQF